MNGTIRHIAIAGTLALALGGCGSKTVTAQNASTAEVAQKVKESGVANDSFISAGRWQMTMTINGMKIPGMPPEMAKRMQGNLGRARTFEQCVTEEEAKKPKEDFFAGDKEKSCRYENFTMGGGKIAMVMHCDSAAGGKQTMKMDGTYSADAYKMQISSQVEARPGAPTGGMAFNATMDARRLGVCTGKEPG
ncbi:MAG TPA: DUF3617 domain-containing protein [Sphingobium sp.]|uniref:DUF3617 domain-containing protein n=1 Tax=Sphingobium sp. TaxID=1912891 RepID=UPI002ED4EC16